MIYSGGSIKATEDQTKLKEILENISIDGTCGEDFYYNFEPFNPKLIAKCYGIQLEKNFESLLESGSLASLAFTNQSFDADGTPILPDSYFERVAEHLRPKENSTVKERYDLAVKLLIRDSQKKKSRYIELKPGQKTGAFYLFIQTKGMANFFKYFGHNSIIFMDSGYRVNRNAFPITFISV